MNPLIKQADEILRKGRFQLLMDHPFWGHLALQMKLIPSPWCPTTAVDAYGRFYYNPKWVAEDFNGTGRPMTPEDAVFEFGHEVFHLMARHHARRPAGAVPSIWNLAGDQIGDTHLVESGIKQSSVSSKMVTKQIMDECHQTDGKIKPIETRYLELEKKVKDCPECRKVLKQFKQQAAQQKAQDDAQADGKKQEQQGQGEGQDQQPGGSPGDHEGHSHGDGDPCEHGGGDQPGDQDGEGGEGQPDNGVGHICGNVRQCCSASMEEADAHTVEEWKQHVLAAAKVAKSKGKIPALAQDFLAQLERPSRDWRQDIRNQASQVYRGRYTQKRPARRSHATNVQLPGRRPKPEPGIVAIDCSGSISAMASRFASEVVGIMEAAGCPEIIVMFHDVVVYHMDTYKKDDLKKLQVSHGGTSHQDVFKKLEEFPKNPGMLVCFTDLYSDQMEIDDPGIPVIWAHPEGIGEDAEIPFGKRVTVINDAGGA